MKKWFFLYWTQWHHICVNIWDIDGLRPFFIQHSSSWQTVVPQGLQSCPICVSPGLWPALCDRRPQNLGRHFRTWNFPCYLLILWRGSIAQLEKLRGTTLLWLIILSMPCLVLVALHYLDSQYSVPISFFQLTDPRVTNKKQMLIIPPKTR